MRWPPDSRWRRPARPCRSAAEAGSRSEDVAHQPVRRSLAGSALRCATSLKKSSDSVCRWSWTRCRMSTRSIRSTFVPTQVLTKYINCVSTQRAAHVASSTPNGTEPATDLSRPFSLATSGPRKSHTPLRFPLSPAFGDDLHHRPEGGGRDVRQRRRDHAEEQRHHDQTAHRPQHAQTAPHQSPGRHVYRMRERPAFCPVLESSRDRAEDATRQTRPRPGTRPPRPRPGSSTQRAPGGRDDGDDHRSLARAGHRRRRRTQGRRRADRRPAGRRRTGPPRRRRPRRTRPVDAGADQRRHLCPARRRSVRTQCARRDPAVKRADVDGGHGPVRRASRLPRALERPARRGQNR